MASGGLKQTVAVICFLAAVVLLVAAFRGLQRDEYRPRPRGLQHWGRQAEESKDTREACLAVTEIGRSRSPQAREKLVGLLENKRAPVAAAAARELGRRGEKEALGPLVRQLKRPEPTVRFATIKALQDIGDVSATGALKAHAHVENPFGADAAWALGRLKDAKTGKIPTAAEDALIDLLASNSPRIRLGAIYGLKDGGTKRALRPLERLAADPFRGFSKELISKPVVERGLPQAGWVAGPCRDAIKAIRAREKATGGKR